MDFTQGTAPVYPEERKIEKLQKIADFFDVPITYFLQGEVEKLRWSSIFITLPLNKFHCFVYLLYCFIMAIIETLKKRKMRMIENIRKLFMDTAAIF